MRFIVFLPGDKCVPDEPHAELWGLGEYAAMIVDGIPLGSQHSRRKTMFPFAGYKTYIVAVSMVGLGVAKLMGWSVPEEVWMMLGGIGLGTLRAAVEEKK